MSDKELAEELKVQIIRHEGFRQFPYEDSVGKLTIGVGRNLDDKGLSESEVEILLSNDIADVLAECKTLSYWDHLDSVRKKVVADMVFNLGLPRFRGFIRTNRAISMGDWNTAAREMLDSRWARQVGPRAERLAKMMATGQNVT